MRGLSLSIRSSQGRERIRQQRQEFLTEQANIERESAA
jgi:hypothetical protein